MRVDATLGFDLEGHFQGHKGQIFFSGILYLVHFGFSINSIRTSLHAYLSHELHAIKQT